MVRRSRSPRYLFAVLAALVILGVREYSRRTPGSAANVATTTGSQVIAAAFAEERSGIWVEATGRVQRTLSDDTEGSRHQRFILVLDNEQTVLMSHNIDLAERIPLSVGESIAFRGMYEWNDRGGVVHWTHHDPDGRHSGGWIRHDGRVFR